MPLTIEAVVDERGNVRLLTPVALPSGRRAIVTILEEPAEPTLHIPDDQIVSPWTAKYEPLRLIGEGGMGRVHLARDRHTGAVVCVKALRSEVRLSAVQQECRALARLNHPSILRLLNFETRGEHPYLVMEYGSGLPMRRYMRSLMLAQEPLAVRVLERLFDAVAYAHQQDVIHRDLKPDNVLIEQAVGSLSPKILDFGLAIVDRVDDRNATTGVGLVAGTPQYMAPEQLEGQAVTGACDVYALGQIGCEMLTGTPAFHGSMTEIFRQKILRDGLPIEPRPLRVSRELSELLTACTRRHPEDRPPAQFAADTLRTLMRQLDAQTSLVPTNLAMAGPLDQRPAGWFDGLGRVEGASIWYDSTIAREPDGDVCSRLRRPARDAGDLGVLMERIPASHLAGSFVRFEARVRTEMLSDWAGLWLRADGASAQVAFDNMSDRPIRGATPWTLHSIQLSLPEATEWLNFGFLLVGGGSMFMRDAQLLTRGESGAWIPLGLEWRGEEAGESSDQIPLT